MNRSGNFVLLFLLIVLGCKNEVEVCNLEGMWYFDTVMRNDRITNTLQEGYFEFKSGSKFTSNIFEEGKDYDYVVTDKNIAIKTDENLELTIEYCSADTLILTGEMSMFKMDFLLTKNKKVDSLDLRSINPVETEESADDELY